MYTFAIIDDCQDDMNTLQKMIKDYCIFNHIDYQLDTYLKSTDFQYQTKYDAIFLDMEMPYKNGLSLAQDINNHYQSNIIFVTSHSEYMHLSFNVRPFNFIHKEYIDYEIYPILDLLMKALKKEYLIINHQQIPLHDICYIQTEDHESRIKTIDNEYSLWCPLEFLSKQLNKQSFFQINRNTIIHFKFILHVENLKITLQNNQEFMISRRLKKEFYNQYQNYIKNHI